MKLEANNLACGYGRRKIIQHISFSVASGETLCLLGPNGVGKTTLFKTLLGLLKPIEGTVLVDGRDRLTYSVQEMAKLIAYVPQAHTPPFPFTAEEVVALGRTAHLGIFSSPKKADYRIAHEAMAALGVTYLAGKVYTQISGGEQQMIMIARALAQQPRFLVLDEPSSNLDFGNQAQVMSKINGLRQQGMGVIMTTHNPDHAFMCATKTLLILDDDSSKSGEGHGIITKENLRKAYHIETCIGYLTDEDGARVKTCAPLFH